ncbi:CHAT domain-containing protein [Actinopolymorpha pittospori]|uniref:Tetratricopeptide (TPR) repeat protein n=1 Tax=Actinopolymorpha pittospori TaxID=648752 RepID=A0A927R6K0_9ACTN|nr:CHAT domain-containing protein [Actinopolymorpha pittospori]MBE1604517.1 tetratricopeptide (TPR) repeat protein [Actinopolymorpha pittospori]
MNPTRSAPAPPTPADTSTVEDRARALQAAGVEATAGGRPDVGTRTLRSGLRLLGWSAAGSGDVHPPTELDSDPHRNALAARLLISLAHAEAEQGHGPLGFGLLDLAATVVAPAEEGILLQQRGLLLLRAGHLEEALTFLNRAEPSLSAHGQHVVLARTLLNRAALHLYTGRIRASRQDSAACAELAASLDLPLLAGKATHNAGYCDLLTGDIPTALAAFNTAERRYAQHGPGFLPVVVAAKARTLLAAGLATEAGRMLETAIADFARQHLTRDVAEAELWRAQAALEAGDLPAARRWALTAERHFRRRGDQAFTARAVLMRLRAEFPTTRSSARFVTRAQRAGDQLRQAGLARDAEMADLLGIRALVAAGHLEDAHARMARQRRPRAPLDAILMRRLARSELALRGGHRASAYIELRAGLAALHLHRSTLGSPDLQAGAAALGSELAAAGLGMAIEDATPRLVFAWSERARAQAFRIPPVRPPQDPELSETLAELRQVRHLMRTAELEGRKEPGLSARSGELERVLREAHWRLRGPGASKPVVAIRDVLSELTNTGLTNTGLTKTGLTNSGAHRVMVCFVSRQGRLYGVVVGASGVRLCPLGDRAAAEEATHRLLADLDALAGRMLPARLEEVIRGSLDRQLDILTDHLLTGLRGELGDADVVIVPTRALSSLPWGMLPDLRGRAVTVAASASVWHTATTAARTPDPSPTRPPLLVAGPDVPNAAAEVAEIATVHPRSARLTGDAATVAATLAAIDGAPTAHLAAHGHHEPESALFSRLELVDGPLMAYDIHGLRRPPRHVTLSACDVGRTTVSTGDEILGFTAALLYGGTSSVVASVARVAHDAAVEVMCGYHRAVAAGVSPARALATAATAAPLAPFVCFGAG